MDLGFVFNNLNLRDLDNKLTHEVFQLIECGVHAWLKYGIVDGPRAVTLPDGTVMTRADLPPQTTKRWVASRKAAVVRGVLYGLIPQSEALRLYNLRTLWLSY